MALFENDDDEIVGVCLFVSFMLYVFAIFVLLSYAKQPHIPYAGLISAIHNSHDGRQFGAEFIFFSNLNRRGYRSRQCKPNEKKARVRSLDTFSSLDVVRGTLYYILGKKKFSNFPPI